MGRKPKNGTAVDRDYQALRIDMQTLFTHVGIAALPQPHRQHLSIRGEQAGQRRASRLADGRPRCAARICDPAIQPTPDSALFGSVRRPKDFRCAGQPTTSSSADTAIKAVASTALKAHQPRRKEVWPHARSQDASYARPPPPALA
jgi:hypothetical protein